MKKYVYIAVGVVIALVFLLVGYGAYLNYYSEKIISNRMADRKMVLEGTLAKRESIQPDFTLGSLRLFYETNADVVTLNTGMLEEIFVSVGSSVKKGKPLARVVSEELEMKLAELDAQLSKANTALERYRLSYERYGRLINDGAVSLERYDDAKANYLGAKAELAALTAQKQQYELQRERLTLKAPFDGQVAMLYKNKGNYISSGTPVALVVDNSHMIFREELDDSRMEVLLPLDKIWMLTFNENGLSAADTKSNSIVVSSKVLRIDPPLGVPAKHRTIYWTVEDRDGFLLPKVYHNVYFQQVDRHDGICVPKKAVFDMDGKSVFVVNKDKALELRKVTLGAYFGDKVEIINGVKEGETVVISDNTGLHHGQAVDVLVKGGK